MQGTPRRGGKGHREENKNKNTELRRGDTKERKNRGTQRWKGEGDRNGRERNKRERDASEKREGTQESMTKGVEEIGNERRERERIREGMIICEKA